MDMIVGVPKEGGSISLLLGEFPIAPTVAGYLSFYGAGSHGLVLQDNVVTLETLMVLLPETLRGVYRLESVEGHGLLSAIIFTFL